MKVKIPYRRILSLVLTLALTFSMFTQVAFASDYEGHWAQSQIEDLISKNIVTPDANGNTNPDRSITRAEMAVLINKAFGLSTQGSIDEFTDVNSSDWFANDIAIAVGSGIFSGSDGKMRPTDPITRQEVAVVITKAAKLTPNESYADALTDAGSIASWAKGSVGALVNSGIVTGYTDGSFKPAANIKRSEAFVIISKITSDSIAVAPKDSDVKDAIEVLANQTYGDASEVKTVENVIVKGQGATLRNLTITGDLTIDESVGEGTVTLEGVTVQGKTYIKGGGANSIRIRNSNKMNSNLSDVIVMKVNVTIKLESGEIQKITYEVRAKLVVSKDGKANLVILNTTGNVTLEGVIENVEIDVPNAILTLSNATVGTLEIKENAKDAKVTVPSGSTIEKAIVDAVTKFLGTGTINEAVISVKGVTAEKLPVRQTGSEKATVSTTSSGGGSSSSSSKSTVSVSGVSVIDATTITFTAPADITGITVGTTTVSLSGTTAPYASVAGTTWTVYLASALTANTNYRLTVSKTGYTSYVKTDVQWVQKVVLASGSEGTADNEKITGLTAGAIYKVLVGETSPTTSYITVGGTLSSNLEDIAPLTVTEITGLTNGTTYKVVNATALDIAGFRLFGYIDATTATVINSDAYTLTDGTLTINLGKIDALDSTQSLLAINIPNTKLADILGDDVAASQFKWVRNNGTTTDLGHTYYMTAETPTYSEYGTTNTNATPAAAPGMYNYNTHGTNASGVSVNETSEFYISDTAGLGLYYVFEGDDGSFSFLKIDKFGEVGVTPATLVAASATITAPVAGATPENAAQVQSATSGTNFTVTNVVWNQALTTGGKFAAETTYTATVTLRAAISHTFETALTPALTNGTLVGSATVQNAGMGGNSMMFTVTFPATAAKAVDSIAVTTQPTKLSYAAGETLDLTGLVATLTYNDGTTADIAYSASAFTANAISMTYTSGGAAAQGDVMVVATHNGKTITLTCNAKTATTSAITVMPLSTITAVNPFDGTEIAGWATAPSNTAMSLSYSINETTKIITATGNLYSVTGFTDFGSGDLADGYYAAFKIPVTDDQIAEAAKLLTSTVFKMKSTVDGSGDGYKAISGINAIEGTAGDYYISAIYKVADIDDSTAKSDDNFKLCFDWDGIGTAYALTEYTINFDDVVLNNTVLELTMTNLLDEEIWPVAIWGTNLSDVSDAIDLTYTRVEGTNTINATGTLSVVTGFEEFNVSDTTEQSGYYVTFVIPQPSGVDSIDDAKIILNTGTGGNKIMDSSAFEEDEDGNIGIHYIIWMGAPSAIDIQNKQFTITIDWDGDSGTDYNPVVYTVKFSTVTTSGM